MFTLSLCMIVKNEEDVIGRCLDCVTDLADEIIIVDTGSTDKTKEIASKYTDKIYDFKWINDFAAARNFSFSKATKQYIMWLDADDVISPLNQKAIIDLKKTMDLSVDMAMLNYDIAFDEKGNPTFSYFRERILKREMDYLWVSEIHEVIEKKGNVQHFPISIFHKKIKQNEQGRNLNIFKNMISRGKKLDPRQSYYYARELFHNGETKKAIKQFEDFLQDGNGWIENNISACRDLGLCYYNLNDNENALLSFYRSFVYDSPRAEICCDIGNHFINKQDYKTAIFWFDIAKNQKPNLETGAFVQQDFYDFTPFMQLCLCYDRLGNFQKAHEYNQKAGTIKPTNKSFLHNKDYFSKTHNL